MQKVRDLPYVTLVGAPGSGKSAMVHHIALKLQEEGYKVVAIKNIRERKELSDPKNPQVFIIDGVLEVQKTALYASMANLELEITQPCMNKSRTLVTCREAVFNETKIHIPFIAKEENVIMLQSSAHALNNNDKKQILQTYGLSEYIIPPALLTSTTEMFPLLCQLFSMKQTAEFHELSEYFLRWGEKKDIVKYCRSPSYKKIKGEICYCVPPNQIKTFVERLGGDIFIHSAFEDKSIKKVALQKGIYTFEIHVYAFESTIG
jgi:energy-coupling factor transporter ATP-binding protein EcfA2